MNLVGNEIYKALQGNLSAPPKVKVSATTRQYTTFSQQLNTIRKSFDSLQSKFSKQTKTNLKSSEIITNKLAFYSEYKKLNANLQKTTLRVKDILTKQDKKTKKIFAKIDKLNGVQDKFKVEIQSSLAVASEKFAPKSLIGKKTLSNTFNKSVSRYLKGLNQKPEPKIEKVSFYSSKEGDDFWVGKFVTVNNLKRKNGNKVPTFSFVILQKVIAPKKNKKFNIESQTLDTYKIAGTINQPNSLTKFVSLYDIDFPKQIPEVLAKIFDDFDLKGKK